MIFNSAALATEATAGRPAAICGLYFQGKGGKAAYASPYMRVHKLRHILVTTLIYVLYTYACVSSSPSAAHVSRSLAIVQSTSNGIYVQRRTHVGNRTTRVSGRSADRQTAAQSWRQFNSIRFNAHTDGVYLSLRPAGRSTTRRLTRCKFVGFLPKPPRLC